MEDASLQSVIGSPHMSSPVRTVSSDPAAVLPDADDLLGEPRIPESPVSTAPNARLIRRDWRSCEILLQQGISTVGSHGSCGVRLALDIDLLSGVQCEIEWDGGTMAFVQDSRTWTEELDAICIGTVISDEKICWIPASSVTRAVPWLLQHGDVLRLANVDLLFEVSNSVPRAESYPILQRLFQERQDICPGTIPRQSRRGISLSLLPQDILLCLIESLPLWTRLQIGASSQHLHLLVRRPQFWRSIDLASEGSMDPVGLLRFTELVKDTELCCLLHQVNASECTTTFKVGALQLQGVGLFPLTTSKVLKELDLSGLQLVSGNHERSMAAIASLVSELLELDGGVLEKLRLPSCFQSDPRKQQLMQHLFQLREERTQQRQTPCGHCLLPICDQIPVSCPDLERTRILAALACHTCNLRSCKSSSSCPVIQMCGTCDEYYCGNCHPAFTLCEGCGASHCQPCSDETFVGCGGASCATMRCISCDLDHYCERCSQGFCEPCWEDISIVCQWCGNSTCVQCGHFACETCGSLFCFYCRHEEMTGACECGEWNCDECTNVSACSECGDNVCIECQGGSCAACEEILCGSCVQRLQCEGCEEAVHHHCSRACVVCDERVCPVCQLQCEACHEFVHNNCARACGWCTGRVCKACLPASSEEDMIVCGGNNCLTAINTPLVLTQMQLIKACTLHMPHGERIHQDLPKSMSLKGLSLWVQKQISILWVQKQISMLLNGAQGIQTNDVTDINADVSIVLLGKRLADFPNQEATLDQIGLKSFGDVCVFS